MTANIIRNKIPANKKTKDLFMDNQRVGIFTRNEDKDQDPEEKKCKGLVEECKAESGVASSSFSLAFYHTFSGFC